MTVQLRGLGVAFEEEYRFHPTRRWRLDFFLPGHGLGIEVEGGTWSAGRHTRGSGFLEDCRKYGAAMELGIDVYRCTTEMVKSGEALQTIEKLIHMRGQKCLSQCSNKSTSNSALPAQSGESTTNSPQVVLEPWEQAENTVW